MGFEGSIPPTYRHAPTRAEVSRTLINDFLNQGRAPEVFEALKLATADTEFRVGSTDSEDLAQISPDMVRDYLAGLEAEEQALVDQLSATNACDPEESVFVYEGWHTQLYVRIASNLGSLSTGGDQLAS